MSRPVLFCILLSAIDLQAQHILHFTGTTGHDHGTRTVSRDLFLAISDAHGWSITDDELGTSFSNAATLGQFDAIVFSNTSGDGLLDAEQRDHFEQWVANGGHVLGIHAASDTYRHSTANGGHTGTWDFYAELIGASVQEGPNHVDGTPAYALSHVGTHASTADLPDPWIKQEEYYYWEGGYFGPDNHVVLEVEQTIGPNGQVNSYDAPRPMSWYRELDNGSRVFYTALGHAPSNFTDDLLFREHLEDALVWLLEGPTSVEPITPTAFLRAYPVPASEVLTVLLSDPLTSELQVLDPMGRILRRTPARIGRNALSVHDLPAGTYLVRAGEAVQRVHIQR